jgi:hypothetical protein
MVCSRRFFRCVIIARTNVRSLADRVFRSRAQTFWSVVSWVAIRDSAGERFVVRAAGAAALA